MGHLVGYLEGCRKSTALSLALLAVGKGSNSPAIRSSEEAARTKGQGDRPMRSATSLLQWPGRFIFALNICKSIVATQWESTE